MSPEVAAEVLPLTSIKKTPQRYHGCRCHRSAYPVGAAIRHCRSSSQMWTTTLKLFNAKKQFRKFIEAVQQGLSLACFKLVRLTAPLTTQRAQLFSVVGRQRRGRC